MIKLPRAHEARDASKTKEMECPFAVPLCPPPGRLLSVLNSTQVVKRVHGEGPGAFYRQEVLTYMQNQS